MLARLRALLRRRRFWEIPFRYERFGGVAQLRWPRALVFVDRERARALGHGAPPAGRWDDPAQDGELGGLLSAPLEAHLQLTNRCGAGCAGCYTGATPEGAPREWGLAEWKEAVDALADLGVFHLALGGGESAHLPWLEELLRHARSRGVVPNLTTSGLYGEEVLGRICALAAEGLLGQINVSLDGVGEDYAAVRGFDGFAQADRALVALRRVTRDVGINCVLSRRSFEGLGRLFAHARARRLSQVELLRFKPAGRGARAGTYEALRCTDAQHRALLPTVLELSRRHRVRVRLDCSLTPMVAAHGPDPRLLQGLMVYGCAGGDLLIAAKPGGALAPCSFAPSVSVPVTETAAYWEREDAFPPFRAYRAAREPCASCAYLALCRGGCRVVSAHVAGDASAPDPECPRVIDIGIDAGAVRGPRRLPVV
jgi:radical SAM protein with 4Fe4S-binding SPASM domain